jgi:hypothetical protein
MGIPSVTKDVIEWINASTNWVLNKNQVSVSKVSDVRPGRTADSGVADFKIVVTNGLNTFDTVAKDVPCDANGIPKGCPVRRKRHPDRRVCRCDANSRRGYQGEDQAASELRCDQVWHALTDVRRKGRGERRWTRAS